MKSIVDIPYYDKIKEVRTFDFGTFYFFDHFFVSEINEGEVFDWEMAKVVIKVAHEILGHQAPVAYISNRINSYSLVPTDWLKFYREYKNALHAYSIVTYRSNTVTNIFLEKMFSKVKIKKSNNIEEAIEWVLSEKQSLTIDKLLDKEPNEKKDFF
ncbi:hypothetical protein [uncultured Croceitalea sp.]|uniref:hypothetical protein n=1 Tax=uncultured Croceitalea sp. TaxID=1798908 RepID=UPI0033058EA0